LKSFNFGDIKIPVPIGQVGMGIVITSSGFALISVNWEGIKSFFLQYLSLSQTQ